ncbi:MAG: aspartyl-phosphate phosphatase Spo0E family protein [Clostridiales bacterium]|jgi:hypothetical protein|nr:aspartyl-phosphate phosphatase Spo0E family protein [Clostridiales bacterium]
MDQDDSRRANRRQMDDLRQKLNEEIEKKDFNLSAPSVMEISVELDHCIVEHYQKSSQ